MKSYKQFLKSRVYRRFVALCGTSGSANVRGMTGKQARRYRRAMSGDNLERYGEAFRD